MDSDFYTQFENNFRGSREQIMEVLSSYDGLIDYVLNLDKNPSLLDIGSGRGEWIQKCNAKGFNSIGIELDSKMVHDCRNLNLNIKYFITLIGLLKIWLQYISSCLFKSNIIFLYLFK